MHAIPPTGASKAQYQELKANLHAEMLNEIDLESLNRLKEEIARERLSQEIRDLLHREKTPLTMAERDQMVIEILNEVFGLGPIECLLADATISDILVNGYSEVYVERRGLLEKTGITFNDDAHLMRIIERIVSRVGRRVDESSPMVDARLKDGSRVNVIIPPLSLDGPILSIRRFGVNPLTASNLAHRKHKLPDSLGRAPMPAVPQIPIRCDMLTRPNLAVFCWEMEFARQVQNRLFPQKLPRLRTLEYAGACSPARQVGGDYYDFLEMNPGRLALVLADIAGKGVSGALLMANLQANLRSQYAIALDDLPRLLESVNHLFYENTTDSSYATLFFADYDDSSRRLRYVNCGHLPPLLLRADKRFQDQDSPCADVERLQPTATVLGLFEKWECSVQEVQLATGDILVLYTDGVTEATNAEGEEFGESRLIQSLLAHHDRPVASLLEMIIADVQKFSSGEQGDDITLVIAQCRGC